MLSGIWKQHRENRFSGKGVSMQIFKLALQVNGDGLRFLAQ